MMIVVTGGAGFIGSVLVWKLNTLGYDNIVIVDELGTKEKWKNIRGLNFYDFIDKTKFIELLMDEKIPFIIETIFHFGACSSTTETNADFLIDNNYKYSTELVKYSIPRGIRFIYASSAATYGNGENGYDDNIDELDKLRPMNMYGYSKFLFDRWIKSESLFSKVTGMKFFNVYGPNEFHKEEMQSVVTRAYRQILETGEVELFKSYKNEYADGEQLRDFIYVKDVADISVFFMENEDKNGLFNVGTGKARTWNDLVSTVFLNMKREKNIKYIEMPEILQNKYQYHTEANINKLRSVGFSQEFTSLEDGINDYTKNYLLKNGFIA